MANGTAIEAGNNVCRNAVSNSKLDVHARRKRFTKFQSFNSGMLAIFILCYCACAALPVAAAASKSVSWSIYHSWNPQQNFVKRGSITWNMDDVEDKETSSILEVVNDQELTAQDVNDMLEYGWYHVKLVPDANPDDFVLGTVPSCHVRRANFKDVFDITLPRSGDESHILSFAYTPLVSPLAPKSCDDYDALEADATKAFQSKTQVKLDTPGLPLKPILSASKPPPGLTFMKRPRDASTSSKTTGKDDEPAYEDPEPKPEPPSGLFGFFQRYWYMILPMVVMQFLTQPPEEQSPPGQQGQAPPAGGGQAAVAAPPAAGSGAKKGTRRGKRN
jgi:hypothetical protein